MSIVIWLLTFVLVLLSVFLVLIVLAQKSKSDGGVGAALGGGMTEATFGADTGNILATMTRNGAIAFFVLCFGLYLAHIAQRTSEASDAALPTIEVPAEAPADATATDAAAAATDAAAAVEVPAISVPSTATEAEAEVTPAAPATTEPAQ